MRLATMFFIVQLRHKLSPEKRFYYERFKALLQVMSDIKINNFSKTFFCKNNLSIHREVKQGVFAIKKCLSVALCRL